MQKSSKLGGHSTGSIDGSPQETGGLGVVPDDKLGENGIQVTFLESMCDSIVVGQLYSASRAAVDSSTAVARSRSQNCLQDREWQRSLRDLAGLLVGYMLSSEHSSIKAVVKRRLSTVCVSEIQCVVQDALARQDESAFTPPTVKLQRWASSHACDMHMACTEDI